MDIMNSFESVEENVMSRCEFDPVDVQEKSGAVWSKKRYEIQTEFELWHTAALWQIMKKIKREFIIVSSMTI